MSQKPENPRTSATRDWSEDMDDMEEFLESNPTERIPLEDMIQGVEKLEKIKIPDDQLSGPDTLTPRASTQNNMQKDELEELMKEQEEMGQIFQDSLVKGKGKAPRKKVVIETDSDDNPAAYEESYASQQETAQIREDFEEMSKKFSKMEEHFLLMKKERENLPAMLQTMRADLNKQLTGFSDKLYHILESHASNPAVASALSTIDEVRVEHSDQLKNAVGHLSISPKQTSPLVVPGSSFKGKGKFKPLK